jgi:hypothetical protein
MNAIDLPCPTCHVGPRMRCVTLTTGRITDFHVRRPNTPGFTGRNERGEQQCLTCWGWKHPAIHSCPGVPQPGRTPPGGSGE